MDHSAFQALVTAGGTITLDAGEVVTLTTFVLLPSGITITTDPDNPATIKTANVFTGLVINGANIRIENVIMDFNHVGTWLAFKSCIRFAGASSLPLPLVEMRDIVIDNVRFIATGEVGHPGSGDQWCVDLLHNNINSQPVRSVCITNCYVARRDSQLTGNGARGYDGLDIAYNEMEHGYANSIAISAVQDGAIHRNYNIHHNTLNNCTSIGIGVFRDGSADESAEISLQNIFITDNYIQIVDDGDLPQSFTHNIFLRSTSPAEENYGVVIARNTLDNLLATAGRRFYTLSGAGTFSQFENTLLGSGSTPIGSWTEVDYEESGMDTMIGQFYQYLEA